MGRSGWIFLAVVVVVTIPASARAQSTSAEAEQLFRDGKAHMGKKQYAEACDAFAASLRREIQITTIVNLADCREKNDQLATAWGLFLEVQRQTRGDRAQEALHASVKKRAAALENRVSHLIIRVPDESRVDGLTISRNGEVVDALTWNRALPVDGGSHTIEGKAPGHEGWSTTVTVASEHDKQAVDVPRFKVLPPVDLGSVGGVDKAVPTTPAAVLGRSAPPPGMSGKRMAAIPVAAVGAICLGGALAFEWSARSSYDDAIHEADDERQAALTADANWKRSFAIGAGAVGVAGVGVALYLWFTGGIGEQATSRTVVVPTLSPHTVGAAFAGRF